MTSTESTRGIANIPYRAVPMLNSVEPIYFFPSAHRTASFCFDLSAVSTA